MADISRIILPSGDGYDLKDSRASRVSVSADEISGSTNVSAIAIGNGNDITETTTISGFSVGGATADYINGRIALYGTSSSVRTFLCLNGQCVAKITTSAFEQTLAAGKYIAHIKWSGYLSNSTHYLRYTSTTFGDSANRADVYDGDVIDTDVPIMIGLYVNNNISYGTAENPTYFDIWITPAKTYNIVPNLATTTANGLMSSTDKTKLDNCTPMRVNNGTLQYLLNGTWTDVFSAYDGTVV